MYFDQMLQATEEKKICPEWHFEVSSTHISPELIVKYELYKCTDEWLLAHVEREDWRDHIKEIVKNIILLERKAQ